MRDLKATGAQNAAADRLRGLTGRARMAGGRKRPTKRIAATACCPRRSRPCSGRRGARLEKTRARRRIRVSGQRHRSPRQARRLTPSGSAEFVRELLRDASSERIRDHVHVPLHRFPRLRFLRVLLALHLLDLLDVMPAVGEQQAVQRVERQVRVGPAEEPGDLVALALRLMNAASCLSLLRATVASRYCLTAP